MLLLLCLGSESSSSTCHGSLLASVLWLQEHAIAVLSATGRTPAGLRAPGLHGSAVPFWLSTSWPFVAFAVLYLAQLKGNKWPHTPNKQAKPQRSPDEQYFYWS